MFIDDIQFLEGKHATQNEFFNNFNTLYEENKQLILATDVTPELLPDFTESLCARFQRNMIVELSAPDYETRIAILKKKAGIENLDADSRINEIIMCIAGKDNQNVMELEGALVRKMAAIVKNFIQTT